MTTYFFVLLDELANGTLIHCTGYVSRKTSRLSFWNSWREYGTVRLGKKRDVTPDKIIEVLKLCCNGSKMRHGISIPSTINMTSRKEA